MIDLGPFIIPSTSSLPSFDRHSHSGFSIETLVDGMLLEHPIFLADSFYPDRRQIFDDLFLFSESGCWPVAFDYKGCQERHHPAGTMVSLSPILKAMFSAPKDFEALVHFLTELRTHFKLGDSYINFPPKLEVRLNDELSAAGFAIRSVDHHGARLNVDIAWQFGEESTLWSEIRATRISFFLKEGHLTNGKWNPFWSECVGDLFFQRLKRIAPRDLLDCFESSADIEALKKHVEWNKLLLLSPDELRKERLEAVRLAPTLWDKPKELAGHLQMMGLYSANTSCHQIAKSIPSLLEELGQPVAPTPNSQGERE